MRRPMTSLEQYLTKKYDNKENTVTDLNIKNTVILNWEKNI